MGISQFIKDKAMELGFSACGIAEVAKAGSEEAYFDQWIAEGYHAGMKYMENHREIRLNPDGLVEGAKSVISVALNYYPKVLRNPAEPYISYYAYGEDYHGVVKDKLRQLWKAITEHHPSNNEARVFTDSAPLLERYWAWKAGLGWIGKNTNLIIPGKGSFFVLGEIVTTLVVDTYDSPKKNHCGSCIRCLDACPTGALEGPKRLNARKCISYLTIEHRGEIPVDGTTLDMKMLCNWYWYDETAILETGKGTKDWNFYRYAETLLSAAEAIAQSSGVNAEAAGYLAQVKARANMEGKDVSTIASELQRLGKQAFIEECWKERLREFPLEMKIWDDCVRTGKFPQISATNKGEVQFVDLIGAKNGSGATFKATDLYWPIPVNEIQRNPNLTQNEGYSAK